MKKKLNQYYWHQKKHNPIKFYSVIFRHIISSNTDSITTLFIQTSFWWHIQKVGPETRDPSLRWDPGPETQNPKCGTQDPGPGTHLMDRNRDSRSSRWDSIPLVYIALETQEPEPWVWINSCALCVVYVYFVCFSLPYPTAGTLLIFYHLNESLFPSCWKNFHHAATIKSLNCR